MWPFTHVNMGGTATVVVDQRTCHMRLQVPHTAVDLNKKKEQWLQALIKKESFFFQTIQFYLCAFTEMGYVVFVSHPVSPVSRTSAVLDCL